MTKLMWATGALAGAAALFLTAATAAANHDAHHRPRAAATADRAFPRGLGGQRVNFGQGMYLFPADPRVAAAADRPYALTGTDRAEADRTLRDFTGPTGRLVQVGQAYVYLPPAP